MEPNKFQRKKIPPELAAMKDMRLESPDKCQGCGLSKEDIVEKNDGWVLFQPGLGPVAFFCCPVCCVAHMNINARSNIEKVDEARITTKSSLLTLPGNN